MSGFPITGQAAVDPLPTRVSMRGHATITSALWEGVVSQLPPPPLTHPPTPHAHTRTHTHGPHSPTRTGVVLPRVSPARPALNDLTAGPGLRAVALVAPLALALPALPPPSPGSDATEAVFKLGREATEPAPREAGPGMTRTPGLLLLHSRSRGAGALGARLAELARRWTVCPGPGGTT